MPRLGEHGLGRSEVEDSSPTRIEHLPLPRRCLLVREHARWAVERTASQSGGAA